VRSLAPEGRKLPAAAALDELADRSEKVATQIKQRVRGEKITDRLISFSDPDARPIRKRELGKPEDPDRLGHPGLQPRHPDHPPRLKRSPRSLAGAIQHHPDGRATNAAVALPALNRLSAEVARTGTRSGRCAS
jgi:hypothetical protein